MAASRACAACSRCCAPMSRAIRAEPIIRFAASLMGETAIETSTRCRPSAGVASGSGRYARHAAALKVLLVPPVQVRGHKRKNRLADNLPGRS